MASIKGDLDIYKKATTFATRIRDTNVFSDAGIAEPEALAVRKRLLHKQPRPAAYDDDYDAPDPEAGQWQPDDDISPALEIKHEITTEQRQSVGGRTRVEKEAKKQGVKIQTTLDKYRKDTPKSSQTTGDPKPKPKEKEKIQAALDKYKKSKKTTGR